MVCAATSDIRKVSMFLSGCFCVTRKPDLRHGLDLEDPTGSGVGPVDLQRSLPASIIV